MRRLNTIIAMMAGRSMPSSCKFSLCVVGLAILFSAACGVQQSGQQASDAGAAQIAPEEVDLAGMRLGVDGDGKSFHVMGQVQNNSQKFTLTELQVKVVLQDCLESGECQVMGEQVATVPTSVPAGQAKDFETHLTFNDLKKAQGTLGWHYSVVAAKASAS